MKLVAKKSLGQHFLVNVGVVNKIVESVERLCRDAHTDHVLEVGPGPGALTGALLEKGLTVIAVELDSRMIGELKEKFAREIKERRLTLIHADATTFDFASMDSTNHAQIVCGNLPYNVGTLILFRFLESFGAYEAFCFMLQKEVVARLLSMKGSDYGASSVKFHWLCAVREHFWVKAGSFSPPPKVDSGVICFVRKAKLETPLTPQSDPLLYDKCRHFVDQLFQKRRKMLRVSVPALKDTPFASLRPEDVEPSELMDLALRYHHK
jgi:16S rRNA (adenine1518-N6/adenine1519-N6)-dimethyltransferase